MLAMGWGTRRSVEGGRLEYSRQRLELGSCGGGRSENGKHAVWGLYREKRGDREIGGEPASAEAIGSESLAPGLPPVQSNPARSATADVVDRPASLVCA